MVRIRYWNDTSGKFDLTGLLTWKTAEKYIQSGYLKQAEIVPDSEYE